MYKVTVIDSLQRTEKTLFCTDDIHKARSYVEQMYFKADNEHLIFDIRSTEDTLESLETGEESDYTHVEGMSFMHF